MVTRKKVCEKHGKNAYPSYSVALRSALRATKRRGTPLRIYFDSQCGSFHITKREKLGWREAS